MKKALAAILCFSMVFMAGCQDAADKVVEGVGDVANKINEEVAGATGADIEKFNAYIELNNIIVYDYYDAIMEYFYFFGVEDAANVDYVDTSMKMIIPSSALIPTLDTAMKYKNSAPKYDLADTALIELEPIYRELLAKLEEIVTYVNAGKFEEDNFAYIIDNHPSVMGLIDTYDAASQKFIDEFDVVADEATLNDLNKYKEEGYLLSYYILYSLHNAELMRDYFYTNDIMNENISDSSYDEVKEIYDEFVMSLDKLQAISLDTDAFADEGFNYSYFAPYYNGLQAMKADMDILMERIKNGENVEVNVYDGTPDSLWDYVESSIDNYNMLISL